MSDKLWNPQNAREDLLAAMKCESAAMMWQDLLCAVTWGTADFELLPATVRNSYGNDVETGSLQHYCSQFASSLDDRALSDKLLSETCFACIRSGYVLPMEDRRRLIALAGSLYMVVQRLASNTEIDERRLAGFMPTNEEIALFNRLKAELAIAPAIQRKNWSRVMGATELGKLLDLDRHKQGKALALLKDEGRARSTHRSRWSIDLDYLTPEQLTRYRDETKKVHPHSS